MRPIERLGEDEARHLSVLLFDLDDTLLDHGALTEAAYSSLFRLREAGLRAVAVTGRPSTWGELFVRQWPIDGAVTENGAVAFALDGRRPVAVFGRGPEHAEQRARLADVVQRIRLRFPALAPSDDAAARSTDFTFDIGEHERVAPEQVSAVRDYARELGARVLVSSVHLHVTFEGSDKASGATRFLKARLDIDPAAARTRAAFIGDSENDEACFGAFATTIAVRNFRGRPTVAPRYVTHAARGAGFAEAVAVLVKRRA